jgi:hypothetical protein
MKSKNKKYIKCDGCPLIEHCHGEGARKPKHLRPVKGCPLATNEHFHSNEYSLGWLGLSLIVVLADSKIKN